MKFVYNLQPLGVQQSKMEQSTQCISDDKCLCCNIHPETQFHLLQCTSNPQRLKAIAALKASLQKGHGTLFSLVIGDLIEQWLLKPEVAPSLSAKINPFHRPEYFPGEEHVGMIGKAIQAQSQIGWQNIFGGFLATSW
jgi:hypothetical protein